MSKNKTEAQASRLGLHVWLIASGIFLGGLSLLVLVSQTSQMSASVSVSPAPSSLDYSWMIPKSQDLRRQDHLLAAINLLADIPSTDPNYQSATLLREQIAQDMADRARYTFYPDDIELAIAVARSIPSDIPNVSASVELSVQIWSDELRVIEAAEYAARRQDYLEVKRQLDQLVNSKVYSTERVQRLVQIVQ